MPYGNGYNPFRDGLAAAPKLKQGKADTLSTAKPSNLYLKTGGQTNGFTTH